MFKIDREKCTGCGVCISACPQAAISMVDEKAVLDVSRCIECGRCVPMCPQGAISSDFDASPELSPPQEQVYPGYSGLVPERGMGRGLGMGRGRGLGRGPRNGRGRGRGGGGRRR